VASLTAGCSSTDGPNQVGGTLIGGATGALLGSQFGKGSGRLVGVGIGALLGSQLGNVIGKKMDERDRQLSAQAAQRTLETAPDNRAYTWKNPNNNHQGSIMVTNTVERSNQVCRDYVQTVIIDGEQQKVNGRACRDVRDSKGVWSVQQ